MDEQLYGTLYTCANCQAVYFINFDGQPEFSKEVSEVASDEVGEMAKEIINEVLSGVASDITSEAISATPSEGFESSAFTQVAKEISDFGNTEVQLAGLNYDLKITGLDTQETKQLFNEAITDLKFGWDATEIMKNIKNGQVELKRLNPVKAYILAKRLQFLDVEKSWQQNAML